jgi:ligand-binding sensor domain-containing protein/signal transduction histidine kinase
LHFATAVAVIACGFAWPGLALDPSRLLTQYGHDHWQSSDGLPMNTVSSVAQTNDGYLWIGTHGGLVRWNGAEFVTFRHDEVPGLASDYIYALLADSQGLWIATDDGLSRFANGVFTAYSTKDGLPSNRILSLARDGRDTLWIGTRAGLALHRSGKFSAVAVAPLPSTPSIWSLAADGEGSLWVATGFGLLRYSNGEWRTWSVAEGLPNAFVRSIAFAPDRSLWIGTMGGLAVLRGGKLEAVAAVKEHISSLTLDRTGTLWIATDSAGLLRKAGDRVDRLRGAGGLSSDHILGFYEDREGCLWIGTNGGGLERFKDVPVRSWGPPEGLASNNAQSIAGHGGAGLWISTEDSLQLWDGVSFAAFPGSVRLRQSITALFETAAGTLWIATKDGYLHRFGRGGTYRTYNLSPANTVHYAVVLTGASDDDLWMGTTGSLVHLTPAGLERFEAKDGLAGSVVEALSRAGDGSLWIGSIGGLTHLEGGRFTRYTAKDGLGGSRIYSLSPDSDGTLWIGLSKGLTRFKNGRFFSFGKKHGLWDDGIGQLLDDGSGNLWIGGDRGIFRLRKNELNDVAEGRASLVTSLVFGRDEGMRDVECNSGLNPSAWRSTDGMLWFATVKGLVGIDPRHLPGTPAVPPPVIEGLSADGLAGGIRSLAPGTQRLEVHYAGLSYLEPRRTQYRYRLAPFESQWIEAGNRRFATYTNLQPGVYRFEVMARSGDGPWSAATEAEIRLEPFFYQQGWFRIVYVLLGIATLWALFLYRLRVMRKRLQLVYAERLAERTRIARELHDTVLQGFSGILMHLEAISNRILENPAESREGLERVCELAESYLEDARLSINDLRTPAPAPSELLDYLCEIAKRAANNADVAIHCEADGRPVLLDHSISHTLRQIVQEAVVNAVRHGAPTAIEVRLSYVADLVAVRIADNGTGLRDQVNSSANGGHFGILGMKERVRLVGGRLKVRNALGSGVEVLAELPVKAALSLPD